MDEDQLATKLLYALGVFDSPENYERALAFVRTVMDAQRERDAGIAESSVSCDGPSDDLGMLARRIARNIRAQS